MSPQAPIKLVQAIETPFSYILQPKKNYPATYPQYGPSPQRILGRSSWPPAQSISLVYPSSWQQRFENIGMWKWLLLCASSEPVVSSRFYRIFECDSVPIFCHNLANHSSAPDTVPIGPSYARTLRKLSYFDLYCSALELHFGGGLGGLLWKRKRLGGGMEYGSRATESGQETKGWEPRQWTPFETAEFT